MWLKALWGKFGRLHSNVNASIRLVWRASRACSTLLTILTCASGMASVLFVWTSRFVVDGVNGLRAKHSDASISHVEKWLELQLLLLCCLLLFEHSAELSRRFLAARLNKSINGEILRKASELEPGLLELAEVTEQLKQLRKEACIKPLALFESLVGVFCNSAMTFGFLYILARYNWFLVLGLAASAVPGFVAELKSYEQPRKALFRRTKEAKRLDDLEEVLSSPKFAKEVRIFDASPSLFLRYEKLAETFYDSAVSSILKYGIASIILALVSSAIYIACYSYIVLSTAEGSYSIGLMTASLAAVRRGRKTLDGLFRGIANVSINCSYIISLRAFMSLGQFNGGEQVKDPVSHKTLKCAKIEFVDVGFRYPGSTTWAIRHLNLSIDAGSIVAVLGENGSGKSTMVKLLVRHFDPLEGTILLDGKDLRCWEIRELRALLSVKFQDFCRYNFSCKDNITIGDFQHSDNTAVLERAICAASATNLVASLPNGLTTELARGGSDDAVDLSGGQWQRVALARALMRKEASLFVLDEPTAALDASGEISFMENIRVVLQCKTTVLITHRYATARAADRIVVLTKGSVIEEGSHDELMRLGGVYNKTFLAQARGYN